MSVTIVATPDVTTSQKPNRRRLGLRPASIAVIAIFVLIAGGLFGFTRHVVDDQEGRLLNERTAEIGSILSSAISGGLQTSMTTLATAAQTSAASFTRAAQVQTQASANPPVGIFFATKKDSGWTVQAAVGKDLQTEQLQVGQIVTGARAAMFDATSKLLRTDVLTAPSGATRLAIAIGAPTAPPNSVVYQESSLEPTRPRQITQSQPFQELSIALYVGSEPVAKKLIISTASGQALTGKIKNSTLTVGAGSWLVVAKAKHPLAGAVTHNLPLILSLTALLIGLLMTALVEVLSRRRDYALSLVKDRTAALESSLTELGETQKALVATERLAALGQMAATVGHELRNPLGVLTNSMYLIRSSVGGTADDKLRRQLDTADREIAAATLIISDLLEFSRPREATPTMVDLDELFEEAASVAPAPSGIDVEHQADGVPPVAADRDQIRQVVLNLLTNAYEAMPNGGTVKIGARVVDQAVEITVADSGVGMSEETRKQVFDPFFSLKIKGTGLGLAVSKRIVEAHNGTLTMESEEGQGCIAVLKLPLTLAAAGVNA